MGHTLINQRLIINNNAKYEFCMETYYNLYLTDLADSVFNAKSLQIKADTCNMICAVLKLCLLQIHALGPLIGIYHVMFSYCSENDVTLF